MIHKITVETGEWSLSPEGVVSHTGCEGESIKKLGSRTLGCCGCGKKLTNQMGNGSSGLVRNYDYMREMQQRIKELRGAWDVFTGPQPADPAIERCEKELTAIEAVYKEDVFEASVKIIELKGRLKYYRDNIEEAIEEEDDGP